MTPPLRKRVELPPEARRAFDRMRAAMCADRMAAALGVSPTTIVGLECGGLGIPATVERVTAALGRTGDGTIDNDDAKTGAET